MKQKHLLHSWLLLLCMIVGGVSSAFAEDEVYYTLDGTITTGGNSNYAQDGGGLTQNNISWSVTGNTTINPWRIGGKNLTGVDREVYSTTPMASAISKVELELGSITLTANSIKLIVASDASFETVLATITKTSVTANSTLTFSPVSPETQWPTGAYYKLIFNVTAGSSNSYVQLKSAKFYKATSGGGDTPSLETSDFALTDAPIALTFDLYNNSDAQVINYTTSSTGAVTVSESDYMTTSVDEENMTITVTPKTSVTPSAQTITVSQAADETYAAGEATFTVTITDSTPLPCYTVTLSDDSANPMEEYSPGVGVTLPTREAIDDYTFIGWSTTDVTSETTTSPETIIPAGTYYPTANLTLYPVYSRSESTGETTTEWIEITTVPADGIYAICSDNGNAMSAEIASSRFKNGSVTISGNKLTKTPADNCIWEIYKATDNYYRIKNGTNYAAATGSNNQGKLITDDTDDAAKWTFAYSSGFTVENYKMASDNKNKTLRNNSTYGWGTYSATTGYAPRLFKKTESSTSTTYYYSHPVADPRAEASISFAEATVTKAITETYAGQELTNPNEVSPITWTSTNEEVATVDNGTVTFVGIGETTIKATFAGNESYKPATVSYTLTLTDPTVPTTVTINAEGITNTNVYTSTAAGTLSATVATADGPAENTYVTWSSSNEGVATINEQGVVTLVAAGTTTITASFAGVIYYFAPSSATYELTVINDDPNKPGTLTNPYTVAEARAAIDANKGITDVYVSGIVSTAASSLSSGTLSYYISDDGTEKDELQAYKGKNLNNSNFSSVDDVQVGDRVVIYGNLKKYNSIYEFDNGNYLITHTYKTLSTIALSGEYPTTFHQGDAFSHDGMTVTATYSDESTKDVTEDVVLTGYDMSATGEQTVTVSYTERGITQTASYAITVNAPATLVSIEISGTHPITFTEGQDFSYEGIIVTANYDDNTTKDVTADAVITEPDMATIGEQTVTVTYTENETEVTTTYTITVTPIPTHTVTWSVNGASTEQSVKEGEAIAFPEDPANIEGKVFVGWVTEEIDGTTDEAPTFVTSATMGEGNVTYYAVFAEATTTGGEVTKSYGFETASDQNWTIDGPKQSTDKANTGSYSGMINVNNSYVTFNNKVKVKSFSFAFTRTSTNSNYNVYIETSTDNSSWTAQETYAMSSFNTDGTFTTKTKSFDGNTEYYVRFHCYNTTATRYVDDVTIVYDGETTTYSDYCTTVVAAAVERPVITVAENPFLFSTTVTITCATEGADIKYSYDGETWNDYSEALTITETKTIYAKGVKNGDESKVVQVTATKNLAEPNVTIDATGITNTNVFDGTEAGSLSAAVTYNEEAIEGAAVTWSGDNEEVATIDPSTGAVTLVSAGDVTFTATYAGNGDFSEKTATYELSVTYFDPNAPGTENNPYTVAAALENTPSSGNSETVYVKGIVSSFYGYGDDILDDNSHRYYISDDGTENNELLVYNGKGLNNVAFSSVDDLQLGDEVIIVGNLTNYNGTKEFAKDNYIVSLKRRADAAIAYETTAFATFPDDEDFVAPTLTNPNNLAVSYTSSNEDVAVVDENTGEVVLGDIEGTATITATFAGNDAYKPGTAEYTITLTKLDAGLAYAETSFEVRVESEFTAPTLTNPNGLTVTYSSSDENVALVDVNSGEVVIGEAGQATITATFAGNTKYNTATAEYTITVIAGKLNAELALNQESLSMNAGTTKALSALYTITSDGQVSFASSDEDYVTISDGKLIAVQPTTEAVTVTISVAETEDYAAASVELPVTVTVLADVAAFAPGSGFTKVTSTEDIVNGEYLIVNETAGVAFDGGLKLLDAASNVISVTITDGTIAETDATKAATFTINVTAGTLKSSSGWYIGKSAYSNGLDTDNAEEHELTNTFSIEEGNAIITAFGGVTLRYNKASDQNRFRYYKSGQQDIQLYRLESSALSIGSAQWRTLVSSANLQFPEKVKAYIVTSSSDEAKLTRVRRVKAGVPVVLNAPEGSYSVTVIDEANCEDTEANLLQVSVQNTTDAYVLANKSQGVGFYKWTGGWMGAGRVYLPLNSANPAGVRTFMPFNLDESTTIVGSMAVGRLDSDAVYNLNGQRVAKPAKGLYIVGGKKVFIK